jgi:hypothetical protein
MLQTRENARFNLQLALRPVLATSIVLALAILCTPVNSVAATPETLTYEGSAYGTSAFVGSTILIGQTAPVTLGGVCGTPQQPVMVMGNSAGVNMPPLVSGGATNTNASSSLDTAQAVADTATISLLAGLISAQEIKAVTTTTIDSSGVLHVSSAGTTVNNLVVAGHVYNGSIPANTRVTLPLLGYVVLNEQTSSVGTSSASLAINMVHVHVTGFNLLGIQVGTEIIVSSATSGIINVFAPAIITGGSFATQVTGDPFTSAATAPESLPCLGTGGMILTNSLTSLTLTGILTSGTVTDTVESSLSGVASSGITTSTVQNLNLLSGLVSANVIRAQTNTFINNSTHYLISGSGQFTSLSVAGHPEINDHVPPNTQVPIAGLGTLYLYRILNNFPAPHSVEVRMVELVVTQTNLYGLPIGLDVIVGDANQQLVAYQLP